MYKQLHCRLCPYIAVTLCKRPEEFEEVALLWRRQVRAILRRLLLLDTHDDGGIMTTASLVGGLRFGKVHAKVAAVNGYIDNRRDRIKTLAELRLDLLATLSGRF